jgi:1,4-alpha-glucan branching enzyme
VANGKSRVPSEIDPHNPDSQYAVRRSIQGAVLALTAPGIPMLFQGQEFLEEGWLRNEAPLDWERCDDMRGVLKTYRQLIRLRRNWDNQTRGLCGRGLEVLRLDHKAKVIAYRRWDVGGEGDETVVVLNLSHVNRDVFRIGFPAPGIWKVRFSQNAEGTVDPEVYEVTVEEQEWDGRPYSAELTLEPYSALILSQDRPA